MKKRDEFSPTVKRRIGARAGFRCSDPDCQRFTVGPTVDTANSFNIGAACHITAASKGGPRYDASLTSEQRKHPDNGIWMCRAHAELVDDDEDRFPVDFLRTWKREAEERVRREVGKAEALGSGGVRFAELSPAVRWGVNAKVVLEDGREIQSSKTYDLSRSDLDIYELPRYTVRFLISKEKTVDNVMLFSLQAVVYKYEPLPRDYKTLAYAYPQQVYPYFLTLSPLVDGKPRPCLCEVYCPLGVTTPVPFAPQVISDGIPEVIDARIMASTSGIYTFALDAVIAHGIELRTFRVIPSTVVLFEKMEELWPD